MERALKLVNKNLLFIRKEYSLTQAEFAQKIGVKRPSVGAYEENRAEPKIETLRTVAKTFDLSLDELINQDLSKQSVVRGEVRGKDVSGNRLRVLSVTVDNKNEENIELIPQRAAAGYTNGFADTEYLAELPRINIPFSTYGTHRAFEIFGDSMLPIESGSVIIGRYVDDWLNIKNHKKYIVVTLDEGIVFKRVVNNIKLDRELLLISDNKDYSEYTVGIENVVEIWEAKYLLSELS